ncbi:MAG: aminotransferase class V-fold PLP-dependent enzyme [Gemmatimonadaceae bacterium]|jgi:alanine-glyoxylate transaminase/serine-glyoxylate transaminase/serine-pyruvate transaminase|nr:aminotransferase class V-fold PLP-dependent enzyme [Gemmatimonadaceae bacterium]
MPGRHHLFVPGPTNVPDRVLRAMHRAQEDHRSSAFPDLTHGVLRDLKPVFGTTAGRPFVFASTGTGMWEAALTNTLAPGDRVLAARFGQFSHLFIDTAERLGLKVDVIDLEWGEALDPSRVAEALVADAAHAIRAVLLVHNETATGVTNDVAAVREAIDDAHHPALLLVDGVSSIGSLEFRFDQWGVDVAVCGSQKGFMMPAGLGMLCLSPKALARIEQARFPRAYFDLRPQVLHNDQGYFPYTPALAHLFGLREALDMIAEQGMPAIAARHARLGEGVRRAVAAWGLRFCARDPERRSNTVTAIVVPDGKDARHVIDAAYRRWDLALGSGLGRLNGKVFRIGHLGDLNEGMILGALALTELALHDAGVAVPYGAGVAAAQRWYRESMP